MKEAKGPVRYLGLTMYGKGLSIREFEPLIERVHRSYPKIRTRKETPTPMTGRSRALLRKKKAMKYHLDVGLPTPQIHAVDCKWSPYGMVHIDPSAFEGITFSTVLSLALLGLI